MRQDKRSPIERAFRVLDVVAAEAHGLSLADIVRTLELPKTTVFMVVSSLRAVGALRLEGDRLMLGPTVAKLGRQAVERMDLRTVALPHMGQLAEQTGLTVHLGLLVGPNVTFVGKVEGPSFIRFNTYVGLVQPFHISSLGKAIAAYLPEAELDELLKEPLARYTPYTTTDPAALKRNLAMVRRQGYAVEDEEHEEGVRCVGAPIFGADGRVAAVSVCAVRTQLPLDALVDTATLVMQVARKISSELGIAPDLTADAGEWPDGEVADRV